MEGNGGCGGRLIILEEADLASGLVLLAHRGLHAVLLLVMLVIHRRTGTGRGEGLGPGGFGVGRRRGRRGSLALAASCVLVGLRGHRGRGRNLRKNLFSEEGEELDGIHQNPSQLRERESDVNDENQVKRFSIPAGQQEERADELEKKSCLG